MYLNFSNFRGQTSAGGGGQALVQKRGQVSDGGGGDWQNFRRMGGPPSPPRKKKPALVSSLYKMHKNIPVILLYKYWLLMREIVQKNFPRWLETVG